MRLLASLAIMMTLFGFSQAEIVLDDISVSKQADSIYVDIMTSKPPLFKDFMINEAPEKIVVDLMDTQHIWPRRNFSNLPFASIDQIRTSQYKDAPELTTRIVLDVNRPVDYRVEELPMGVRVVLPAVEDETDFSPWSVKQSLLSVTNVTEVKTIKPVVKEKKPSPPKVEKPKVQSKVDDFPKRKVVDYKPGSNRDPFKPLVGPGTSVNAGMMPSVENLTLVGVFNDDTGVKALFEDAEGNGYILKPNDRVQNGYLVSIRKDKAVFQVTEYGWTRTIALDLQMPELK